MKVLEERITFVSSINSLSLLAMTVPETFFSAISFAKFGPLRTPTLLELSKHRCSPIKSDIVLKGSFFIPFVQDIIFVFFAIKGFILITIVSNIELGVAMKIMEAFLTTLSKLSEAFIFSDNFSSG